MHGYVLHEHGSPNGVCLAGRMGPQTRQASNGHQQLMADRPVPMCPDETASWPSICNIGTDSRQALKHG